MNGELLLEQQRFVLQEQATSTVASLRPAARISQGPSSTQSLWRPITTNEHVQDAFQDSSVVIQHQVRVSALLTSTFHTTKRRDSFQYTVSQLDLKDPALQRRCRHNTLTVSMTQHC